MKENPMLEAALRYLEQGWSVIPLEGKRPLESWVQYQKQRATERKIEQWWRANPQANVGVVTGAISGIIVLDVDGPEGKRSLEENGLDIPKTVTGRTGGGGWHYFFKHPGGQAKNFSRRLPGIDLRGDGGQVVVPPSVHPSGNLYEWENSPEDTALAEPPAWLLELIQSQGERSKLTAKDWETDIPEGQRDEQLTRLAGKLLGPAGISPVEAFDVLLSANERRCKPPLPQDQVEKIVKSIAGREAGKQKEKQQQPFTLVRYRDFMKEYSDSEIRWLAEEWLPIGGIGKIVGPPESYKTWILLDLAVSVASGEPFLGKYKIRHSGPVLFFQQEDGNKNLGKRLNLITCNKVPMKEPSFGEDGERHWLRMPPEIPIQIRAEGALEFDKPESIQYLGEIIEATHPALVVLDPLYSAASTKDYMMDIARTMLAIKEIREEFGTAFILGHHSRKGGREGDREEGWGSQFLNAFDEFQWQVRVKKDGRVMVKRRGKISSPLPELSLLFDIKTENEDWFYSIDVAVGQAVDEETERTILHGRICQLKTQGYTYKQIEKELGVSSKTIGKVLKESAANQDSGEQEDDE